MSDKVAVVGSINIDLVSQVHRFPLPGETVLGGDLQVIAGGKGANQAVAAARLGADAAIVGRLGDDVFAARLRHNLGEFGLNTDHIYETAAVSSGAALILVDKSGQNTIVVAPGANARVSPADVDSAEGVIARASVLLLQLEIPLESCQRAAEIASRHGLTVILNPAPAQKLPPDLLSLVTILVPNETEASALSGLPGGTLAQIKIAAARIRDSGVENVIVTAGDRGAVLSGAAGGRHYPAIHLDQVVDTTAAGDAFLGALAVAVAEGKNVTEAVPWGNAAGALAASKLGAQPSLPTRAEVEALLRQATADHLHGIKL